MSSIKEFQKKAKEAKEIQNKLNASKKELENKEKNVKSHLEKKTELGEILKNKAVAQVGKSSSSAEAAAFTKAQKNLEKLTANKL